MENQNVRYFIQECKQRSFCCRFQKSRKEDETLANVIELKRADITLTTYEKSKESREV